MGSDLQSDGLTAGHAGHCQPVKISMFFILNIMQVTFSPDQPPKNAL